MITSVTSLPIVLSMGDPAGIGPEIIVDAFAREPALMRRCIVLGDLAVMRRAAALYRTSQPELAIPEPQPVPALGPRMAKAEGSDGTSQGLQAEEPTASRSAGAGLHAPLTDGPRAGSAPAALPVFQACTATDTLPRWGKVQQQAGRMAADCITCGAQAVLQGRAAALVTAPIHKEALALAGVAHPGHTEMLQALAAAHAGVAVSDMPVRMMLANPELRTVLNSIHVSLRQAIAAVQPEQLLQTIRITDAFLRRTAVGRERAPRIALAGLNPHAGEGGLFGDEELTAIIPARDAALAEGIAVSGPYPPDTVFMQARQHAHDPLPFCDVVIAMYHDQGLIPVKYLGVEQGVNVTLGLPLIRTSPDHGTAFDLAGRACADSTSLRAAVRMASELAQKD